MSAGRRGRAGDITFRCDGCGSVHELESVRRNLYYGQRAIGDAGAFRRGGALGLGRRIVRRRITRALMRGLWGN